MSREVKDQIADKLLELAAEGGIEKVTVRQLAERSHISRQTFYNNFEDIFSVTEWQLQRKMREAAEECVGIDNRREAIEKFAERLSNHLYLVRAFLNTKHRAEMEKILLQGIKAFVDYTFAHSDEYRMLTDEDRAFLSEFFSCGTMQYIVDKSEIGSLDVLLFSRQMDMLIASRVNGGKSLDRSDKV